MPWFSRLSSRRSSSGAADRDASRRPIVELLEHRRLLHAGLELNVSFQPNQADTPADFIADTGRPFSYRAGNGHRFGWTNNGGGWLNTWSGRRDTPADAATDSFIAMGHRGGLAWELAVPNGMYTVTLAAGDSVFRSGETHRLAIEGEVVLEHTATAAQPGKVVTVDVDVQDGRLTITAPDGVANSKIAWVRVRTADEDGGGGDNGGGGGGGGDGDINLGSWTNMPAMPKPVMEGGWAQLNGTIYAWGGYDTPNVWRSRFHGFAFDTQSNSWRSIADLPQALTHFQALTHNGKIYIFGGYVNLSDANGARDDVWVYDPQTDSFSHFADMPFAIAGHGATMVGSRAYVISGMFRQGWSFLSGSTHVFSIDLDNPGAGWRTETSTPVSRDHTAAVTINGMIYLVSGQEDDEQHTGVKPDLYRYDPGAMTWSKLADMPDGGRGHIDQSVLVYKNHILVLGGNKNGSPGQNYTSTIFAYNVAEDEWFTVGNLPLSRVGGGAALVNDDLYYFGGFDGIPRPEGWRAALST